MRTGCKVVITGLAIAAISTIISADVKAQEVKDQGVSRRIPLYPGTILDEFNNAYYFDDRDYFQNRSIIRQIDALIGPAASFTDNEINRDAKAVHETYLEALARQNASGPILRTVDMPTPFTEVIRTVPTATTINRFTSVVPSLPPVIDGVSGATATPTSTQVPALW